VKNEDEKRFIVDAAVKVLSKKGHADITADAGMSYGLVYHCF